jgi:hypothetical protein
VGVEAPVLNLNQASGLPPAVLLIKNWLRVKPEPVFFEEYCGCTEHGLGWSWLNEKPLAKAAETRFMHAQGLLAKTIRIPKFTRLGVPRIAHFLTV